MIKNRAIPNKIISNKIMKKPKIVFLIRSEIIARVSEKINKKTKQIPTIESWTEKSLLPNGSNVNTAHIIIIGMVRKRDASEYVA